MSRLGRVNSISALTRFMARTSDGQTVEVKKGETFKLQDVKQTGSGELVHFAMPQAGLVLAISESQSTKPWRLSRV